MNILFTSAGRRVELLRAFRDAYRALGLTGRIVVTDIDTLAPALHVADRTHIVPPYTSDAYIPALLEICVREEIGLVFPLIDDDIPLLAAHRAAFAATGARLAVVAAEAAAITADKWLTAQFFARLGLVTPHSMIPEQFDAACADYPVFIKPRDGSASKNAFVARNAQEAAFFLGYVPFPIVQEYLPGPEITTDVVCGLDGRLLGIVSRQRIAVRGGEVVKGITVCDERILDACERIALALPAVGPITVQCMMRNDVPYFTEINARFGGGLPLGIAAGVNAPLLLLADAAGLPSGAPPLGAYQTGLYMTRYDESFFLTEQQRVQMAGDYLRSR